MKTYSTKDKLHFLLNFYEKSRGVGHTKVLWDGANSANCYIAVNSEQQFKHITKNNGPLTFPFNLNDLDSLHGRNLKVPLAWDNQTLYELFKASLEEIIKLESGIKETKEATPDEKDAEIAQLRKTVQDLTNFIEQVNGIFNTFLPKEGK